MRATTSCSPTSRFPATVRYAVWRCSAGGRSASWTTGRCCSPRPRAPRSACWSSCVATCGRCAPTSPRLGQMRQPVEIGDAALLLAARHAYPHRYDLGDEWKRWTGLPFVFAMWAARRAADPRAVRAVHQTLLAARDWGLAHLDLLAEAAARATGVGVTECRSYLAGLDYALTDTHLAGLTDFFRRLAARGLVPDGSLQFLQVA